jgi:hypothetical protein
VLPIGTGEIGNAGAVNIIEFLQTRWFRLNVLASFYGPNAVTFAEQLRDGLYIGQNQEQLALSGIKLIDAEDHQVVPDLFNLQWIDHVDLPIRLAAVIERKYNVLDIISSEGTITNSAGVVSVWNSVEH